MTNNSHFNPCFWTAFWNEEFFSAAISGQARKLSARNHVVSCLNLSAKKIIEVKVAAVHKHNGLGSAEFTYKTAVKYRESVRQVGAQAPKPKRWKSSSPVFLDAESWFSGLEGLPIYKAVIDVVVNGGIKSPQDKMNLAAFFVIHNERVGAAWASLPNRKTGQKNFNLEHILMMRHRLSNRPYLLQQCFPVCFGAWYLHDYGRPVLLLGDTGFPQFDGAVLAAISPQHLVEIDTTRILHAHLIPKFEQGNVDLAHKYNLAVMSSAKHEVLGSKEALQKYTK